MTTYSHAHTLAAPLVLLFCFFLSLTHSLTNMHTRATTYPKLPVPKRFDILVRPLAQPGPRPRPMGSARAKPRQLQHRLQLLPSSSKAIGNKQNLHKTGIMSLLNLHSAVRIGCFS